SVSQSATSRSTAECARTDCASGATVRAAGVGTRFVESGGRCAKKSLASAPIQQRHALIDRLREQMPQLSVRKLCRALGVNRQWYYQHHHPSAHQQDDERLRQALQELREAFTGYGYRRVTKALVRAGWKVNHKRVWRVLREAKLTC